MNFYFQPSSATFFVHLVRSFFAESKKINSFRIWKSFSWIIILFTIKLFRIRSKCKCNSTDVGWMIIVVSHLWLVTCDCSLCSQCLRATNYEHSYFSFFFFFAFIPFIQYIWYQPHIWVYWFDDMEKLRTKQRKRLNAEFE